MKKLLTSKITSLLLLLAVMASCVEPYALETRNFESAVVIEATITDELKNQEIKISKTYRFEENGPTFETAADVFVTDDQGTNYEFAEQNGKYVSTAPFQAEAGRSYTLNITLADGQSYRSTPEILPQVNTLQSLNAAVVTTPEGERGVSITANSFDPTGNSKYYRYEYEETYKIVAPYWASTNLNYDGLSDLFFFTERLGQTKTCYNTVTSNTIITTNSTSLSEDRISNFPVRFISDQNYIISHRYSILVKQYIQSLEAYTFYETMNKLSGSESLLSQNQPGFFYGNIKSVENPAEKVIGFFDVSSVSEKRLFFNYADLFPSEPLPPYFDPCEILSFDVINPPPPGESSPKSRLILLLSQNTVRYYDFVSGVYEMVIPKCGDCTTFASNIVPSFWED